MSASRAQAADADDLKRSAVQMVIRGPYERELARKHLERQRRMGVPSSSTPQKPLPKPALKAPLVEAAATPAPPTLPSAPRINFALLLAATEMVTDVTGEQLCSKSRYQHFVTARYLLIALCKEFLPEMSLPVTGRRMGGRDHTTVLHGRARAANRLADDARFAEAYRQAKELVGQALEEGKPKPAPCLSAHRIDLNDRCADCGAPDGDCWWLNGERPVRKP
jgi:hypothetical protein